MFTVRVMEVSSTIVYKLPLPLGQQWPVRQDDGAVSLTTVGCPTRLANVEKRFCTVVFPHWGQRTGVSMPPEDTSSSNSVWQWLHKNSKSGISNTFI